MSRDNNSADLGKWIAIGIAMGAGIGVAIGNVGIGIAIGLALGAAISWAQQKRRHDNSGKDSGIASPDEDS